MTAPSMRPARPREPNPAMVAANARRNHLRNIDRQLATISQNHGPHDPRIDNLLEQRRAITQEGQ